MVCNELLDIFSAQLKLKGLFLIFTYYYYRYFVLSYLHFVSTQYPKNKISANTVFINCHTLYERVHAIILKKVSNKSANNYRPTKFVQVILS